MKYGIKVPSNAEEAARFDREKIKPLCANAILKELKAIMMMSVFEKLLLSLRKARVKGYHLAPLCIVFMLR